MDIDCHLCPHAPNEGASKEKGTTGGKRSADNCAVAHENMDGSPEKKAVTEPAANAASVDAAMEEAVV